MGDVASGNDGFLSGYKFAVKFRFGGTSLLPLQVFFLKISSRKPPGKEIIMIYTFNLTLLTWLSATILFDITLQSAALHENTFIA